MRRFVFFLLFLVCLYPLSTWVLKGYCHFILKSELSYEQLTLEKGRIIIDQLTLSKPDKRLFKAEQIIIEYFPQWFEKRLICHLLVKAPEIELMEALKELHLFKKLSWLEGKLMLEGGKLQLVNGEIPFDLVAEKQGEVNALKMAFGSEERQMVFKDNEWHLKEIDAKVFSSLIYFFLPSTRHWEIETGLINGCLQMGAGELHFSDLSFSNPSLDYHLSLPHLQVQLQSPLIKLKGDLRFRHQDLNLEFQQVRTVSNFKEATFILEGLFQGETVVADGTYSQNALKFEMGWPLAKLLGEIYFDHLQTPFMNFHYKGMADHFHPFFTEPVELKMQVKKAPTCFKVTGRLDIQQDHCLFGVDFSKEDGKWQKGWFSGKKIPIDRHLAPLIKNLNFGFFSKEIQMNFGSNKDIFSEENSQSAIFEEKRALVESKSTEFQGEKPEVLVKNTQLQGVADVHATFNPKGLDLSYSLCDFKLENPYFSLEAKPLLGSHHFDFVNRTHRGKLPSCAGSLLDKTHHLLFTDLTAQAKIEAHKIGFEDMQGRLGDITFAGRIDFDYDLYGERAYDVEIRAHTIEGKASEILSYFKKPEFLQHLDGTVMCRENGVHIRLTCSPDHFEWKGDVQGSLAQGSFHYGGVCLQKLQGDFDFTENSFDMSHLQGVLRVAGFEEEVRGSFTQKNGDLTLSLGDLELKGEAKTLDPHSVAVSLKGEETAFSLLLNENIVENFTLTTQLPIPSIGTISAETVYDHKLLKYHLSGENIELENQKVRRFSLEGVKRSDTWSIDQCELDDLSFSADLTPHMDGWKIDFLGLKFKDAFLMGLEGKWVGRQLEGRIHLLKAHIPTFSNAFSGHLHAQGPFTLEYSKLAPKWKWEAFLNASLENFKWQDLEFSNIPNLTCQIRSDRGITLNPFQATIPKRLEMSVGKIDYDINHGEWEVEACDFHLIDGSLLKQIFPQFPVLKEPLQGRLDLQKSTNTQFQINLKNNTLKGQIKNGEVTGEIPGLFVNLTQNQDYLTGEMKLTFPEVLQYMPATVGEIATFLKLKKNFTLTGNWDMGKRIFHGAVDGRDVELNGCQLQHLHGDLTYTPEKIMFQNLLLQDKAGTLQAAEVTIDPPTFFIPQLTIHNFKPSLLLKDLNLSKSLAFKEIALNHVQGNIFSPATYTSKGSLNFTHSPKYSPTTFFTLPADNRMGMATPVKGEIDFEIKENKIYFTGLKNGYSEGKIWKFTLPDKTSFLDFEGTLNMRLKMKQTPFTEPYLVHISGSLDKPVYTLQREKT